MIFSDISQNFAESVDKIIPEFEEYFVFEFFNRELVRVHGFLTVDVSVFVVMVKEARHPSTKQVVRVPGGI